MKLNINPKEFLALYNLLHSMVADDVKPEGDMVHLSQVHGRMKAYVLSSLTNGVDPVDAWFKREQSKINELKQNTSDVQQEAGRIREEFSQGTVLDLEEIEVEPSYPRPPRMPKPARGRR